MQTDGVPLSSTRDPEQHTRRRCPPLSLDFCAPQGPPARCALRVLAKRYLDRSIQGGSHDSAVDARTALDLALLKMRHGPAFGLPGSVRQGLGLSSELVHRL